jgi:hypothetical protein
MPKLEFEIARDLQAAGASQELAEAVVRAISEKQTAQLATKADLIELRGELKEDFASLELSLTTKMASLHTNVIIWLVGIALGIVALVVGILKSIK